MRTLRKPKDLTGKILGVFTFISVESTIDDGGSCRTVWTVKCSLCGKEKQMRLDHIKKAMSCGCLGKQGQKPIK